jgi:SAM-dependent methyltransferase
MIKVASCDKTGSVFIDKEDVYRTITNFEADKVIKILSKLDEGINGLIETEILKNDDQPDDLKGLNSSLVLRHRKVQPISYPHEWCASMYKDASLFHLELSKNLHKKGLFLKDAHPWNILFDSGKPVFVDITSIVSKDDLFNENYLNANNQFDGESDKSRINMISSEIFNRMLKPYFLNPLLFYATGNRDLVRSRIENSTINASTSLISENECMPRRFNRKSIYKFVRYLAARFKISGIYKNYKSRGDLPSFYSDLSSYIERLPVDVRASSYSNYYSDKDEDQNIKFCNEWNNKQKEVHNAINSSNINTVLDVACNTGWFALMAESLDKHVTAFDIDESCVDVLYQKVKSDQLNILPLVMNFTNLTETRYSIYDGNPVLINAIERLKSDSVMVLGIIHHLVLGLGMTFEEILEPLSLLTNKQLIIEYVEKDDDKILNESTFFPAYHKDQTLIEAYDLNKLISHLEKLNFKINIRPSYPETRKMLICNRQ